MKRGKVTKIIALVLAFGLLAVTAYAAAPRYEGYEAFKALVNNHDLDTTEHENATVKGSFQIVDNGQTRVSMDVNVKTGDADHASGVVLFTVNGIEKELNFYAQDEKVYIFDLLQDTHYVVDKKAMDDHEVDKDESFGYIEMSRAQEELMDFIMGDLKNNFHVDYEADGSETITFELTKAEMPMLLNLIVSAANGQRHASHQRDTHITDEILLQKYPILGDFLDMEPDSLDPIRNVALDYIQVSLTTLKDDFLKVAFDFRVTGDDEAGVAHVIQMTGAFEVSKVGTTVVDVPDLEGKGLIEINPKDFERVKR